MDPAQDLPLDPSYEDTNIPTVKHDYVKPYANADNVKNSNYFNNCRV